ncbi:MAG: phosphohistidine phosphatase SixA [Luteitalea sp.]|nr:phosphohistidine phosphatase SixA [Luteitalea sp.]
MHLYLVHHGDALPPDIEPARPLSPHGLVAVQSLSAAAAARDVKPVEIWHSGKRRARQTAEVFWQVCNPLAAILAQRGLQPDDPPGIIADQLAAEDHDTLIVGHMPHLPALLRWLVAGWDDLSITFPPHGLVALERSANRLKWSERWRLEVE